MKKLFIFSTFLILNASFASPVLAKATFDVAKSPAGGPIAPGQIWQGAREDVKETQQDVKKEVVEATKETKGELRNDVAQIHATRLKHRFLGIYYPKLDAFIQKVQAKIDSMAASGKIMAEAQSELNEAKAALQAAKTLADQSIAGFEAIEPAKYNIQRQQAVDASQTAKTARAKFVETIKLLKNTLKLMREAT